MAMEDNVKYNDIMVPLRLAAMAIALIVFIVALCSFNHPFDLHVHLDHLVQQAQEKAEKDQIERIIRDEYIRTHQEETHYYEVDHSGTYDRYTGTYERNE